MATFPKGNPTALGLLNVAVPGTLVNLTANFTDLLPTPDTPGAIVERLAKSISVQADPSNTGNIFVGVAGMVRATGVGVFIELAKGQFFTFSQNDAPNAFDVGDFFIDADTAADKAYVFYHSS